MAELSKPDSKWSWYLKVFPNYDMLDLPMFWSEATFATLSNTCIHRNVEEDLIKMKKEFADIILPFVQGNRAFFSEKCLDFEYYKQIVAFIMSYSFRDPNEDVSFLAAYFTNPFILTRDVNCKNQAVEKDIFCFEAFLVAALYFKRSS